MPEPKLKENYSLVSSDEGEEDLKSFGEKLARSTPSVETLATDRGRTQQLSVVLADREDIQFSTGVQVFEEIPNLNAYHPPQIFEGGKHFPISQYLENVVMYDVDVLMGNGVKEMYTGGLNSFDKDVQLGGPKLVDNVAFPRIWVEVVTCFKGGGKLNCTMFVGKCDVHEAWTIRATGFKGGTLSVIWLSMEPTLECSYSQLLNSLVTFVQARGNCVGDFPENCVPGLLDSSVMELDDISINEGHNTSTSWIVSACVMLSVNDGISIQARAYVVVQLLGNVL